MTYKLFIDDERFPPDDSFVIVRTSDEATSYVLEHGNPSYISFDHDLGEDDTSMVFLHWWLTTMLDGYLPMIKGFSYYVHSQNPIGKKNIEGTIDSFVKHVVNKQLDKETS